MCSSEASVPRGYVYSVYLIQDELFLPWNSERYWSINLIQENIYSAKFYRGIPYSLYLIQVEHIP